MNKTDSNHFELLKNHGHSLIKELYEKHWRSVEILVTRNGGSQEDAKQILTDTLALFIAGIKNPTFKIDGNVKSYVESISIDKWAFERKLREMEGEIKVVPSVRLEIEDETLLEFDFTHEVRTFAKLTDDWPSADLDFLRMFFLDRNSTKDVADSFNLSSQEVKAKRKDLVCKINVLMGKEMEVYKIEEFGPDIFQNIDLIQRNFAETLSENDITDFSKLCQRDSFIKELDTIQLIQNGFRYLYIEELRAVLKKELELT